MNTDDFRLRRAQSNVCETGEPYPLGLTFDNGTGTTYALDWDIPGGGRLVMSPRDKALARALLELALANVDRSETAT